MYPKMTRKSIPPNSPLSTTTTSYGGKEPDRYLPIANVSRIMKKSLPLNAKISKEAKETVQECVSEFISFITGEASDKCQKEKRKTINGDDLLWAMTRLGFENYVGILKAYLSKYRESEGDQKSSLLTRHEADDDGSSSPMINDNDGAHHHDQINVGKINVSARNGYLQGVVGYGGDQDHGVEW